MFIARDKDNKIILAKDTKEELEEALQFMVYETIEATAEDYQLCDGVYLNKYDREAKHKAQFDVDFFNTSLGYVRRKVSMSTGETKDFLSDLLPAISAAVTAGTAVNILTYDEPDFTVEEVDWTKLQHVVKVTPAFVQECFKQLSVDFLPINAK